MNETILPELSCEDVLNFQFSSWHPLFKDLTMKSTIIRPLSEEFHQYLLADGIYMPDDSEDVQEAQIEETNTDEDSDSDGERPRYSFPELNAQIRRAITEYGAVFPKLNFTSPKDASWIISQTSPLKCTSPSEVYLLLKASNFINHDLSSDSVFDGCAPVEDRPPYQLELVLRKWFHIDTAREFRCFVRQGILLGISQRDGNLYDYMLERDIQEKLKTTISTFWSREINGKWPTANYIFDMLLTRNLDSGHILDFQPYASRTDTLLFTFEDLEDLRKAEAASLPVLRVFDSSTHPTRSAPAHVHNMVPLEFLTLSAGQTVEDFSRIWQEEIQKAMVD